MSCMRTVKRFFCMKIIFIYNLYGGNRMPNTKYSLLPWQFLFISLSRFFSAIFASYIFFQSPRCPIFKIYGLLYKNLVTYICIELINKNLDVLKFLHWKIWNMLVWQFVYHASALLYDKWIQVNYFFILFFLALFSYATLLCHYSH